MSWNNYKVDEVFDEIANLDKMIDNYMTDKWFAYGRRNETTGATGIRFIYEFKAREVIDLDELDELVKRWYGGLNSERTVSFNGWPARNCKDGNVNGHIVENPLWTAFFGIDIFPELPK